MFAEDDEISVELPVIETGKIDQAIYIASADDVTQYFSANFAEFLGLPDSVAFIGAKRIDMFRFMAERGDFGPGEPNQLAVERMAQIDKNAMSGVQRQFPSGRFLEIRQHTTADGGIVTTFTDITAARRLETAISTIAEAVSYSAGQGFLQNLTNALSRVLGVEWAVIGTPDTKRDGDDASFTTIVASRDSNRVDNFSYKLQGSPCEKVIDQSILVVQRGVQELFPDHKVLAELGIQSYAGAPLFDAHGNPLGVLAIFDPMPLEDDLIVKPVLEIFASRAAAEMERLKTFEVLATSERRFRNFAELGSDWLWELDADLRFSWIADQVEATTGLPPKFYIGRKRSEIHGTKNDPELWARLVAALESHEPFQDIELRHELSDGRIIWVRSSGAPRFSDDGEFLGYVAASSDITAEVVARDEVRSGAERLAEAIGGAGDPVALYGADDRLVICNDAYLELHSEFADKLQPGISFREVATIFAEIDHDHPAYDLEVRMQRHRDADGAFELDHPNGRRYLVQDKRLTDGSTIIIAADITTRRDVENELREAKELAEEANRSKSRFLASVSHELRTPLNAIIGFSEIIGTEMFGEIENKTYVEYGRDIGMSGQLLLGLISDILDVSQIDAGEMSLKEGPEDVRDLVDECVHLFEKRAAEANIDISTEVANTIRTIRVDGRRLKQILVNLIGNAIKFTPSGGWIKVWTGLDQDGRLVLEVADSGIGMAADDIARAMEPFSQIKSNLHQEQDGVGLGLSIANRLAALHGGQLQISSELGVGTKARIVLPADRILSRDEQPTLFGP
ncbi:MAG: PAS domain-containing protein [Rhodospirillaceae bacterium]|nr:PAS domain-containing protein [Rhodospirillaceae bacterium]MBT5527311.1 PAS domain-containing protein [Rhodospirillaceae bacterium]MBT5879386.1 PAS domain-containing protein [Rhodospirillaceae bacterium]MBT7664214.1 PAS domain-containing protein [Rhodospirillaceae bacterium]